jgi:CheY-like chemotaxis protein
MLKKLLSLFRFAPRVIRLKNARILVVEDNPVDKRIICNILQTMKYQVLTAENGAEGLKIAKTLQPDLIIMDCEMPVMNGRDACRELKSDPSTANIPVVFLTSVNTPQNIIECFDLEAENYLSKPVSAKILQDQIPLILKEYSA